MAAYDTLLAQWPVKFESLQVPTRFGTTHVIASGPASAPPMILLPALMTTAGMWQASVSALSTSFRVYAVDTIGEPNKSEPSRAQRNLSDAADWLTDLLDGLSVERASLVGCSLGGLRAMNQALTTPNRIDKVVLISPTLFPLSWKFYWYASLGILGSSRLDEWMGNGLRFNPANQTWADVYTAAMSEGRLVNDLSLGGINEKELAALTRPTLLLVGDREVVYNRSPEEVIALAKKQSPMITGELVPRANHLASMVNPEFVNERILRFMHNA